MVTSLQAKLSNSELNHFLSKLLLTENTILERKNEKKKKMMLKILMKMKTKRDQRLLEEDSDVCVGVFG